MTEQEVFHRFCDGHITYEQLQAELERIEKNDRIGERVVLLVMALIIAGAFIIAKSFGP